MVLLIYIPQPPLSGFVNLFRLLQDSSDNQWWIATHVEDVSPECRPGGPEAKRHSKDNIDFPNS
jgi:hypothetical protein